MNSVILKVEDLRTYFFTRRGVVKAIDGVSFCVQEGETLGIVGESGSGKTVTSLSILRLVQKPAGRIVGGKIIFDGKDMMELTEVEMRSYRGRMMSMILQDPMASLNPVYTIGDQVAEPVKLHQRLHGKKVTEAVISALRMLKIPSPEIRLRDYPHQMSGGMKQRVGGAIAISCHPRLLIADEPTTALDATIQAQYLALLKDIQRQTNVAIIFITHDFGIVAKMCRRVAVMYAGKIVETAETRKLFETPKHPYTVALLNSVPRLEKKVDRLYSIEGQPPQLMNLPPGCRFQPRCPMAIDICREQQPAEVEIGDGHFASCWRLN
jgi:oligopeptide/dipeptide ABC transporter ATP-binding protein